MVEIQEVTITIPMDTQLVEAAIAEADPEADPEAAPEAAPEVAPEVDPDPDLGVGLIPDQTAGFNSFMNSLAYGKVQQKTQIC